MNSDPKKKNHANHEAAPAGEEPKKEGSSANTENTGGHPEKESVSAGKEKHAKNGKIEIPLQEYESLKNRVQELEGLREKFLHAAADFENAKKRNLRDKDEFIKFSQERILRELLPVLDNFERAVGHGSAASSNTAGEESLQQNFKTLVSGVQRVQKQLLDILKMHGLKKLQTIGQHYDPHFHEVVGHVAEEGKEDHIVDEFEPGYTLHDRLLRAAKVRIRVSPKQPDPSVQKQDEIT